MRRSWRTHAGIGAALLMVLISGIGAFYMAVMSFYPACVADFSEATIVAPDSVRGHLLCRVTSDGDLVDRTWFAIVLVACIVLTAVASIIAWVRRNSRTLVSVLAVGAIMPWVAVGTMAIAPAECSSDEWDRYGAAGCERNEELRPGLSVY